MSEARNIVVDGPDVMAHLCDYFFGLDLGDAGSSNFVGAVIDASPIYTEISGSVILNGSYIRPTDPDYEFIYDNVEFTFPALTRIYQRDPALSPQADEFEAARSISRITGISSYYDRGFNNLGLLPESRFLATQGLQTSGRDPTVFTSGQPSLPSPLDPPLLSAGTPFVFGFNTGTVIFKKKIFPAGIVRYIGSAPSPPPDEDVSAAMALSPPYTTGSIEGGNLGLAFRVYYLIDDDALFSPEQGSFEHIIDASTWGSPQLRDIRGTYGNTETDSRGLTYTWSLTIA